jgi:hypothetical protein
MTVTSPMKRQLLVSMKLTSLGSASVRTPELETR